MLFWRLAHVPLPAQALYTYEDGLRWATQMAQGLAHLHDQDPTIIHRDLKLDNILLSGAPPRRVSLLIPVRPTDPKSRTCISEAQHVLARIRNATSALPPYVGDHAFIDPSAAVSIHPLASLDFGSSLDSDRPHDWSRV